MTKDLIHVRHELQKARERVRKLENEETKLLGVYAVVCRSCSAQVNHSCVKGSGIRTRPHRERIQDAVARLATL